MYMWLYMGMFYRGFMGVLVLVDIWSNCFMFLPVLDKFMVGPSEGNYLLIYYFSVTYKLNSES